MTLAIVTPYDRSDTTAAALTLAQLAVGLGLPVRLIAAAPVPPGVAVHPHWDARVSRGRTDAGYRAARGAERVVWFAHDPSLFRRVTLVAERAHHTLVPSWHRLRPPRDPGDLGRYHRVVCPSRACAEAVLGKAARKAWVHWGAGTLPAPRAPGPPRGALLYADAFALRDGAATVLRLSDLVLGGARHSRLTVLLQRSVDRRDRARLAALAAAAAGRLSLHGPADLPTQARLLDAHDLLVYPGQGADFGTVAMRALACGVPTAAFAVPPLAEMLVDDSTGVLVPCERLPGRGGAALALAPVQAMAQRVVTCLRDRDKLASLRPAAAALALAEAPFAEFWASEWGLNPGTDAPGQGRKK